MRALSGATVACLLTGVKFVSTARTRSQGGDDRVSLANVKVLTLYTGMETAGRRSAPVPQLSCQGGCGYWIPDMVQCYNMRSDGRDAAWKCEASMPDGYSLSSVEVGCEGYDYPDDPFILKDSCQVVYSLNVPPEARRSRDNSDRWGKTGDRDKGMGSRLLTWALLGVVGYVVYNAVRNAIGGPRAPGGGMGRGGGGGGGGGWGGGGGDNWQGGSTYVPPTKSTPGATAPPQPDQPAAQGGGGLFPWVAGGAIGAAVGHVLRPRPPRRATGGGVLHRGAGGGNFGGGAYRRRDSGGGSRGREQGGGGSGLQAGYGGTTRR